MSDLIERDAVFKELDETWTKQDKSLQGRCELMQMYPTGEWFCGNAQKRAKDEARIDKR